MSLTLPVIVINLDRVPARMALVRGAFEAAGIAARQVERFAAIDAQEPGFAAPGYAPGTWRERWSLTRSEQAIFESHRVLWHRVASGQAPGAVICEDDILVSHSFGAAILSLDLAGFGVIKLDGFSARRRYGPAIDMGRRQVREILGAVPSAACYALGRVAAQRLIEDSTAYCATLDDYLFAPRPGVRPVQMFPAVAVQGMCCRTDDAAPIADIVARSERGGGAARPGGRASKGPLLYRLRKELRRARTRLGQAAGGDRRLHRRGGVFCRPDLAADLPPLID